MRVAKVLIEEAFVKLFALKIISRVVHLRHASRKHRLYTPFYTQVSKDSKCSIVNLGVFVVYWYLFSNSYRINTFFLSAASPYHAASEYLQSTLRIRAPASANESMRPGLVAIWSCLRECARERVKPWCVRIGRMCTAA